MQRQQILPYDGEVIYHGVIFTPTEAAQFYEELLTNIPWQHDEAIIFGRHFVTPRKVAWYGDLPFLYRYSGKSKVALPWTPALEILRSRAATVCGATYNSCLMNLYHHGGEGMAYHSDDEPALVKASSIASLSFGATRKFLFRHKVTRETVSIVLEPGSILEMKGTTQQYWLHRLPTTKKVSQPRVNLTYRLMESTAY